MRHAPRSPALAYGRRHLAKRLVSRRRGARWLAGSPLLPSIVGVAMLVCAAVPSAVLACHNIIAITVDELARRVTHAEKRLTEGDTVGAVQVLRFALGISRGGAQGEYELAADPRSPGVARVRARGERLLAVAVVRRDGLVDRPRLRAGWVPDGVRAANFVWAERILGNARRDSPDAPVAIARHAEALARIPGRSAEALTALGELDRRDLVPDAWGYAVLARLADTRHDVAARDRAVRQCTTLGGAHAGAVCPSFESMR